MQQQLLVAQVPYSGAAGGQKVKVAHAVRLGHSSVTVPVTGTTFPEYRPAVTYFKKPGQAHTGMGDEEYCHSVVEKILFEMRPTSSDAPVAAPLVWVHDRDTAHSSKFTAAYLEEKGIKPMLLPPRSPDLDPLDYGVFGAVKHKLRREADHKGLKWPQRARRLMGLLKEAQGQAAIEGFATRLWACIAAKGGHIERS